MTLQWLEDLYQYPDDPTPREKITAMFNGFSDMLQRFDFTAIDAVLIEADWTRLSPTAICAMVRYPNPARGYLTHWVPAIQKAHDELTRRGCDADRILMGLTKWLKDASWRRLNRFTEHPETVSGNVSPDFVEMALLIHPDQEYSSAMVALLCRQAYDLGRTEGKAALISPRDPK